MRSNILLLLLLIIATLSGIDQSELTEESLVNLLDHYRSNPVNINTASENEIYSLPYISEITASKIYDQISQTGKIKSLNELVKKSILSEDIAGILEEIIIFEDKMLSQSSLFYQFRTKRIIERSEGYLDSSYLGNRSYFLNKFKFKSEHLKLNFLAEKEAGEISYTDNFKFSIEYDDDATKAIAGTFNFFSATKLLQYETMFIDPYSLKQSFKFHDHARSSLSSMDYYGFNGIYVSHIFGSSNLAFFYGEKPISVVLSDDKINSVNLNAYTRTENEINRYYNEKHFLKGFSYQFIYNEFSSCLTITDEQYTKDLTIDSKLHKGIIGELHLKKKFGDDFIIEINDATDMENNNLVINSLFTSNKTKLSLYLSRIERDKLSLTSQGII
ncbi:MAG: helix-hairpin-helix domain-containing protein [Candidatus Delongbacteria bacterium]|nr:helix-hairpin-helix domain-containing protein [Candidatus Delongbacteria bacterium]